MIDDFEIQWPAGYSPRDSGVHVVNELAIAAPPQIVWAWLVRADLWPAWYSNSSGVQYLNPADRQLFSGCRFRWKTFGVSLVSEVKEFVEGRAIGWDARCWGVSAYHVWLLLPTDTGCLVRTEETQNGLIARLADLLMPDRMHRYHQLWLLSLARMSLSGALPASGE